MMGRQYPTRSRLAEGGRQARAPRSAAITPRPSRMPTAPCRSAEVSVSMSPLSVYATERHAGRDSSGVERLTVDQDARVQFPFPVPISSLFLPFQGLRTLERSRI